MGRAAVTAVAVATAATRRVVAARIRAAEKAVRRRTRTARAAAKEAKARTGTRIGAATTAGPLLAACGVPREGLCPAPSEAWLEELVPQLHEEPPLLPFAAVA